MVPAPPSLCPKFGSAVKAVINLVALYTFCTYGSRLISFGFIDIHPPSSGVKFEPKCFTASVRLEEDPSSDLSNPMAPATVALGLWPGDVAWGKLFRTEKNTHVDRIMMDHG